MFHSRTTAVCFALLGLILLAYTLGALAGCAQLQELDKRLWGPTGDSAPMLRAPGDPAGAPDPDQVPPIVQTAAGILALAGYGGMAAWIRRSNRNGRQTYADLEARLRTLEGGNHT
ncbi:unnamed protein product [marine sediment metagenome]|uniref:Lipoprotein n=1 Tax=marine sediment metagenome TaxID=412755 RepID=X1HWJ8_9ZZZZ